MAKCRNCKFLMDMNYNVASDRGWCHMWGKWQKCDAQACKYQESKPAPVKESYQEHFKQNNKFRGNAKPRYQKSSR